MLRFLWSSLEMKFPRSSGPDEDILGLLFRHSASAVATWRTRLPLFVLLKKQRSNHQRLVLSKEDNFWLSTLFLFVVLGLSDSFSAMKERRSFLLQNVTNETWDHGAHCFRSAFVLQWHIGLLAPSGALIAIPAYYWPSTTTTTTPLFQI